MQGSAERPDILVEDAAGWPVAVEAEWPPAAGVEEEAQNRLYRRLSESGLFIETAIALIYPLELDGKSGQALRDAILVTEDLRYALYTHRENEAAERLPNSGWLRGNVRDLAMLLHRAAAPAGRVDALAKELETGVEQAADLFTKSNPYGNPGGAALAEIIGQADDDGGQTRRMAMTIIANALVFHSALAAAHFQINDLDRDIDGGGGALSERSVRPVDAFRESGHFSKTGLTDEWSLILERNYYPIFRAAREMIRTMSAAVAARILDRLWRTAEKLVTGGVTRSHDLTGILYQSMISDRKFLATFYTRPAAAAMLATISMPEPSIMAAGEHISDRAPLLIGDFACGTGTLLSAAYQRLSFEHELSGGDSGELHALMMRNGLVGLDVLNSAVHLTAAMLAGSHPRITFDGECLLTVPYGQQEDGSVEIGSLSLLSDQPQISLMGAAAETAGGRAPEEVRDLVARVEHDRFDLVIMNPPFTRSGGQESDRVGIGNAAFAAFGQSRSAQSAMQRKLATARGTSPIGTGNAGLAADFLDLALRKVSKGGTIAMVLPSTAVRGTTWRRARNLLRESCSDITVVTLAGSGSHDRSFSSDTGIAECLLIAKKGSGGGCEAKFVVLDPNSVRSTAVAALIGLEIARLRIGEITSLEAGPMGGTRLDLGDTFVGEALRCHLPVSGPWGFAGVADALLAQTAYQLEQGILWLPGMYSGVGIPYGIIRLGDIADRGPYHLDIDGDQTDGSPRGPFIITPIREGGAPTYPLLYEHDARRERQLTVPPDTLGRLKTISGGVPESVRLKARDIWATATRAHYNADLRFNSQSLIVAMTPQPAIGGTAWPSVVFQDRSHEFAFALWGNSTLGLLAHWWRANKSQSGRGRMSITGIPELPILDVADITPEQHAMAKQVFEELSSEKFLPFDQIDEDPARAELDRRLLVEVLGLPEELCEPGGAMELLRRKLAAEPQIHGGKKTRIIFEDLDEPDPKTGLMWRERTERRDDR